MPDTMTAARWHATEKKLLLEEVPVPEPGPLEVLVEVHACGICLSDVHLMDGTIPPILDAVTLGHEAAGVIVRTGDGVAGWGAGDRVTMMGGRNCMKCERCLSGRFERCAAFELMGFHYDGAWAHYVVVPFFALSRVPEHVPFEQAAILADAVATPYGALKRTAALQPAETIGLWGIGGLGTHAVQIARLLGASLIVAIDPLQGARERALRVGADVALDPTSVDVRSEVHALTRGIGLDVGVDFVGANAVLKEASSCLARGGRAVMVGLSMERIHLEPSLIFGTQSHAVLGHLGYSKSDLDDLVKLLASGRLDLTASVSDVLPLSEVEDGVRRLTEKEGDPVRLVVRPTAFS